MTPAPAPPNEAPDLPRALVESILRAAQAMETETAELRAGTRVDLDGHRRRKDLCLLDLTRRWRGAQSAAPGAEGRAALLRLRESIIANQAALKIQMAAARTVADALLRIIADEESDRTYARPPARRRKPT